MITPKAQTISLAGLRISRRALERAWLAALIALALFLAVVNLPYAPRTWFDEGSHLHVPKTIVQHGVYADISSEGYRYYGPTIGVGPTVMLPIALVFKLFGVGLLQGRLVIVAYLLIALAAFYALARRMHGSLAGLLALTLLLASRTFSYEGLVEYGRQVVGEVPGVAFLLLGTLAWLAALRRDQQRRTNDQRPTTNEQGRWRRTRNTVLGSRFSVLGSSMPLSWLAVLAGLGFGMALVTKNQFVLIIPPALFLAGLLDWRYYRAGSWQLRLIPLIVACGCFGLWTLAQFQFLGPGSFVDNMRMTRQAAGGSIFVFSLGATLRAGYYLLRPDLYGGLLIPSLAYSLWRARRQNAQGLAEMLIVLIIGLWLTWYVGASLGWPRYAFPAVAFGALPIARMLADLLGGLWRGGATQRGIAVAVAAYAALAIAMPLAISARAALRPDDSAQQMAAYLDANVPHDVVVETWEPELGVLTDHRYHYPPIALLDTAVRHQWLGGPALIYDGLRDAPAYVVVGGFGSYTGVYASDSLAHDYIEQQRFGSYVLYKRK
jgi:4-amino-4-deoxy-L-arabinose transferase-like glycosyltransferase